jgi:hypothetical protein
VIVDNLDFVGIPVSPLETDAPLIIDTNAMLAQPIAYQFFQAIGWRASQVLQRSGVVEHAQFTQGNLLDIIRQSA